MWGMTVICFWDMVSQITNGDVGNDSNMLLGCGQSEYQRDVRDDSNMLFRRGLTEYQWGCGG